MTFFIKNVLSKLFADDTTFYSADTNLADLIIKFKSTFSSLMEWCNFNKIDINFSKTVIMIITRKHIDFPKEIDFNGISVKVVQI